MKKKHPTINRYYCKAMGHRCTNSSMKRIEMSDAIQIQHVPSECGILFGKTMEISSNVCVLLCFGKVSFETNATTLDCEHISCRICQQPAQSSPQYLHKKKKNIFLLWTSIKLHSKLTHESHEEQNPCSKPCTPNPKPSPRLHPLLRFSHRIPRSVANDNQLDTFVF